MSGGLIRTIENEYIALALVSLCLLAFWIWVCAMVYLAKIFIALVVFTVVAEVSKNSPKWGGLISAIPWITLLVVVTRHQIDQATASELIEYLMATFWFILPTLLFIAWMAGMLRYGASFYVSLATAAVAAAIANGVVAIGITSSK